MALKGKKKEWREGELILTFNLLRIDTTYTPLMQEWVQISPPQLGDWEHVGFEKLMEKAPRVPSWSEEDLKMKFIAPVLELGKVMDDKNFPSFFDRKLEAVVEGHALSVKADFTIARGMLDYMERPFFHFQVGGIPQYKPHKNPSGDPMAQLLEAFLIAQAKNEDKKPIYGCEVVGKNWTFVVMEAKTYCVSKSFDCTDNDDLLMIIGILRKFKEILETRLGR